MSTDSRGWHKCASYWASRIAGVLFFLYWWQLVKDRLRRWRSISRRRLCYRTSELGFLFSRRRSLCCRRERGVGDWAAPPLTRGLPMRWPVPRQRAQELNARPSRFRTDAASNALSCTQPLPRDSQSETFEMDWIEKELVHVSRPLRTWFYR